MRETVLTQYQTVLTQYQKDICMEELNNIKLKIEDCMKSLEEDSAIDMMQELFIKNLFGIKEEQKEKAHFLGTLNTGGGCMVDVAMNKEKNIALILNDEGYTVIEIKDYNKFLQEIEEKQELIKKEWGVEADINDDESIAWLLLDIQSEMFEFNTATYEYFIEFDMLDENENTIWYENLDRTGKTRVIEDILKDIK